MQLHLKLHGNCRSNRYVHFFGCKVEENLRPISVGVGFTPYLWGGEQDMAPPPHMPLPASYPCYQPPMVHPSHLRGSTTPSTRPKLFGKGDCRHLGNWRTNKERSTATTILLTSRPRSKDLSFLGDLAWAGQEQPKGRMWPASHKNPRPGFNSLFELDPEGNLRGQEHYVHILQCQF